METDRKTQFAIQKNRDFRAMKKNAPIIQQEFGFYSLENWKAEGFLKGDEDLKEIFGFDGRTMLALEGLGWCEASFCPAFPEKLLEDRGEYELVQDFAGRHVLYFKGRRDGFMPEYVDHPVKDWDTWERDVKWRLSPDAEGRFTGMTEHAASFSNLIKQHDYMVAQCAIGGYMYLRSLVGPEGILYMVYDEPKLVHDMMKTWFELADRIIAFHQKYMKLDELFLAEDICYNHGPLIAPDMIREFLFPYYQQLIANIKARQKDKTRHLHIQIDTDGDCRPVIPVYQEIGADYFSPFEVASGCDVVELRKQYPQILMRGGIDKRILAAGKDAISREIDRIMPFMKEQGGYIPVCDHGVPAEVKFEDYLHYRNLMRCF